MVIYEQIEDTDLVRAYSDSGVYIFGGDPETFYTEAVDQASQNRTYRESDIPINKNGSAYERATAYNILMGAV